MRRTIWCATIVSGESGLIISIHAAVAENGVIGRDGDMPWRLSSDLKRFKALTMGKPIIMGRKTWAALPKRPLPGRLNIVVTRDREFQAEGAAVAHDLDEALALAGDAVCVIGGGEIYALALPRADALHITHVLAGIDGDTRFPEYRPLDWEPVSHEEVPAGEKDSHATRYSVYRRAR
jgi:dihydrofolate reductase